MMKMFVKMLAAMSMLALLGIGAWAEAPEEMWYELSFEDTVVTVRLPAGEWGDWGFSTSDETIVEFLTSETVNGQWVASFRTPMIGFGYATLTFIHDEQAEDEHTLELFVSENGAMEVLAALETRMETAILTTGDVYLRAGAGVGHRAIAVIEKGTTVTGNGACCDDARGVTWFKVQHDGMSGWISSKYAEVQ